MSQSPNSKSNSKVRFVHETKNKFDVFYETSFVVLPDAKTILGADASDAKTLIMEDIGNGDSRSIGRHSGSVQTILFDRVSEYLLVGDYSGHVLQYKKTTSTNLFGLLKDSVSFALVKDLGHIGVGSVCSSVQLGGLAFFGGDHGFLAAVDIPGQCVLRGKVRSPFQSTYCLRICHGSESVCLAIGGLIPIYSPNVSDVLDVSRTHTKYSRLAADFEENDLMKLLLSRKDQKIDSLQLRVQELESELLEVQTQSQGTSEYRLSEAQQVTSRRKRTAPGGTRLA